MVFLGKLLVGFPSKSDYVIQTHHVSLCNLCSHFISVGAKQTRTFSPSFSRGGKEKSLDVSQILPSVKFIDG